MGKYDFDSAADRCHSDAIKYCELEKFFGRTDLLPMWIADMDFNVCPDIREALARRIAHPVYGYAAIPRDYFTVITRWLRHRHNFEVAEDEITYIPGVVKGIGFIVNRFCRPGDKIVIQPPVYHPFKMVIEGNDCRVVANPLLHKGDRYEMDLDGLRHIVATEHPRMLILCNPHNPIGIQWSRETLAEVAAICAEAGVLVISDEIHGDLMLQGRPHIPFLAVSDQAREVGMMLGAPSKTFNIPGLVSSWCVVKNPALRHKLFDWLTANEFNEPTFFATCGTEAAYTFGEQWLDEALDYIQANVDHVAKRLEEISSGRIKVIRPQASFLLWLDCRGMGLDHDGLVEFFTSKAGLALNDGAMFGSEGSGYKRMNVAAPRATIDRALAAIEKAFNQL